MVGVKRQCIVAKDREKQGVVIQYTLEGTGPHKVLFIMGMTIGGGGWDYQTDYLASLGEYQACSFDNRGVGHSSSPSGLYTTSAMALDTKELLDHLGWTKDVHIVGISMGGMIALELALIAPPGLIKSLCLTSTHAGRTIPPVMGTYKAMRHLFARSFEERIMAHIDLLYSKAWLEQTPPNEFKEFETHRDLMFQKMCEHFLSMPIQTQAGALGQFSAMMRHYVSAERLVEIGDKGFPILVVTGTRDNLIRSSNSIYLADKLGAKLIAFKNSGHVIPCERAHEYNVLLLDLFNSA